MEFKGYEKSLMMRTGAALDAAMDGCGESALMAVVREECSAGREEGLSGMGAHYATARLLRNDYGADETGELAVLMISDLAMQRHAAEVFAAGEAFAKDGSMPEAGKFEYGIMEFAIPDIAYDEDAKADWKAMSEGRFDEVSLMSVDIIKEGVKNYEHVSKEERERVWKAAEALIHGEPESAPVMVSSKGPSYLSDDSEMDLMSLDGRKSIER